MWCTGTEQNRTNRSTPCSEPLPFLLRKCTQRTAAGQTHLLSKGSFPAVFILEGIFLSCAFAQCFYNIFLRIAYKSVFFYSFFPGKERSDTPTPLYPYLQPMFGWNRTNGSGASEEKDYNYVPFHMLPQGLLCFKLQLGP